MGGEKGKRSNTNNELKEENRKKEHRESNVNNKSREEKDNGVNQS